MSKSDELMIDDYPMLKQFADKITVPQRPIVGREQEMQNVLSVLLSPEYANPVLVGEAGVGKTEIVRAVQQYLQNVQNLKTATAKRLLHAQIYAVNTQALVAVDNQASDKVGYRLQKLFDEQTQIYEKEHQQIILFIDEFHLLAKISKTALQSLKPVLANSGIRHNMLIAATTLEEYDDYIRGDHALEERLVREDVLPLSDDVVVSALRDFANLYAPGDYISDDLLHQIVDMSNRYVPSEVQPRKSMKILDGLIGRHNVTGHPYDIGLLIDTLRQRTGINVAWETDPKQLSTRLSSRVFGQKVAISTVIRYVLITMSGLNDPTRPLGSFLFTGPTGVGKTELAKQLAKNLLGSEDMMIRFDMSEYSDRAETNAASIFRETLTREVYKHPSSIILFDEVEKAQTEVIQLLLQVLDDARLTDAHGRETSFKNCYVIATSNSAAEVYQSMMKNEGAAMYSEDRAAHVLEEYTNEIKKNLKNGAGRKSRTEFPTELLNRFDAIVPFMPLAADVKEKIVRIQLQKLAQSIREKYGVVIRYDGATINTGNPELEAEGHNRLLYYFASSNGETANTQYDTDAGGGRQIKRKIDQQLKAPIARVLTLSDKVPSVIAVTIEGELEEEVKHHKGTAHVVVGKYEPKLDKEGE